MASDEGAMIVFVSLAVVMMFALAAFVLDQGVILVARTQLQTAADAGALAGAMSRVLDNPPQPDAMALATANANPTQFSGSTGVEVDSASPCPGNIQGSATPAGDCVRVNTYRNGEAGGAYLPRVLAGFIRLGPEVQQARAMAIAEDKPANRSTCMRPILIADQWMDDGNGEFGLGEIYVAPSTGEGDNEYAFADISDDRLIGPLNVGARSVSARNDRFYAVDAGIATDACMTVKIGDSLRILAGPPDLGPLANVANASPSTVTVGVFSPAEWEAGVAAGNPEVRVINLIGLRLEPGDVTGATIEGRVRGVRGELVPPYPEPVPVKERSLMRAFRLVR